MKKDLLLSLGKLFFEVLKLCSLVFILFICAYSLINYIFGGI